MTDPKRIEDLAPDEITAEMDLREKLRALAELREHEDHIVHVSRRPDTGDLNIRRDTGEIVVVPSATVDAYLATREGGGSAS
jgi:hypothetical protein